MPGLNQPGKEPFGENCVQQNEWIRRKGETLKFPVSFWSVGAGYRSRCEGMLAAKTQPLWRRLICDRRQELGKEHGDISAPQSLQGE